MYTVAVHGADLHYSSRQYGRSSTHVRSRLHAECPMLSPFQIYQIPKKEHQPSEVFLCIYVYFMHFIKVFAVLL